MVVLDIIAAEQSNSTQATDKAVTQILNFAATHLEAIIRYHVSGMFLHINSNAYFLSE